MYGRFVSASCKGGLAGRSRFSRQVAPALSQAVVDGALAYDTGGLLAAHGVARFAAERDPEALAQLPLALGYSALAISVADLAAPRKAALTVWHKLRERGIDLVASNLRCTPQASDVCAVVETQDSPIRTTADGARVAFIHILRPDALAHVAPEEAAGLSVDEPAAALARAVKRAHELNAEFVVASYDGSDEAVDLAHSAPPDDRPDLLIAARAGDKLFFARTPDVRPAIVATRPGTAVDVNIRWFWGELDFMARPLEPIEGKSAAVDAFAESVAAPYCAVWGRALAGGKLSKPLDADGFLALTASIVQGAAHAEAALVNRAAIYPGFEPADPAALSASDVFVALPYDEPIDVAMVSGEWLSARAKAAAANGMVVAGVSADGAQIAGRPIEPKAHYRVATLRFLARGGDAALPAGEHWSALPGETLRSVVLSWLEQPRAADPRDAAPNPAGAVAWLIKPDVDARVTGTSIENPAAYPSAPLQRASSVTAFAEANLRTSADVPAWQWENLGLFRYRSTRTSSPDPTIPATVDHDDLETLRSTFVFREAFGAPQWYLPQPYAEGYGETEAASAYTTVGRRFIGRLSAGTRFVITPQLNVKVAAAVERQIGDLTRTLQGLNVQLTLLTWQAARFGQRALSLDATADVFVGGLDAPATIRAHGGVLFDLIGPLSLVVAVDWYAERDAGAPFGRALDASAGLRLRWVEHFSTF